MLYEINLFMIALTCYIYLEPVDQSSYIIYHHKFLTFPTDDRFIHSPIEITKALQEFVSPQTFEESEV